jgi:hypothetical protein
MLSISEQKRLSWE